METRPAGHVNPRVNHATKLRSARRRPPRNAAKQSASICGADHVGQDRQRLGHRHRGPVRTLGGQGVEDVPGRDDAGFEHDPIAGKTMGIALAVEPFVMGAGDRGEVRQCGNLRQDRFGMRRMQLHGFPFLGIELAGLVEDGVADAELADVVQQRRAPEPSALSRREPELLGDHVAEQRHPLAVAAGVGALGVDDLREGGRDIVEIIFVDGGRVLRGFEREDRPLQVRRGKHAPERRQLGNAQETLHQSRIEPGPRAMLDLAACAASMPFAIWNTSTTCAISAICE